MSKVFNSVSMSGNLGSSKLDILARTECIFYNCTDAKFTFNGGDEIKVNKTLLACNASFFYDVFLGESPKDEYFVSDFDSVTFKYFLDCLMGFKPYTDLDSLLIFPIAHKYRTEESLVKCIEALKPKAMSETVCHTLNLALYYECQELIDNIIDFLRENFSIRMLLETEKYCLTLEPISVIKLLENIEVDSYLVKIICSWAKNYMKSRNKSDSVVSFMKEHKIFNKIQEFQFELKNENSVSCKIIYNYFRCYCRDGSQRYSSKKYSVDKGSTLKMRSKVVYKIAIPERVFISSVIIIYSFNVDCKILKTSSDGAYKNDKKLYYTYDVMKMRQN